MDLRDPPLLAQDVLTVQMRAAQPELAADDPVGELLVVAPDVDLVAEAEAPGVLPVVTGLGVQQMLSGSHSRKWLGLSPQALEGHCHFQLAGRTRSH